MIVYNLVCNLCDVTFEGWFESSSAFLKQKKQNYIKCPSCNSDDIKKALMAPNLSRKSNSKKNKVNKSVSSNISKLKKLVEKNFEYVGDQFSEEAKKIKYGESKERSIYGEATLEQTKELIDEEIEVVPLPFSPKKSN